MPLLGGRIISAPTGLWYLDDFILKENLYCQPFDLQCKSKLVGHNTFCIGKPSSRPPPTTGRFHRPQGRFPLTKSNFTRQRRISLSYILSDTMIVIYRRNLSSVKKYKKTPTLLGGHFMCWHLPIFPGRHQPSIFGTTELNFCVRYGNRWTLSVINTNLLIFLFLSREQYWLYYGLHQMSTLFLKKFKIFSEIMKNPYLSRFIAVLTAFEPQIYLMRWKFIHILAC